MIEVSLKHARPRFTLDIAFEAGPGITALFGESGSGKSTILNLISGLERPDSGRIILDKDTIYDSVQRIDIPVHRRRIGYVFQDALLFPHLSVRQNLIYGRRGNRIDVASVVDLLDIGHVIDARPATLSGGERQRVAIGRALLSAPRLLLMDEPLASLDIARKREILPYIERLNATYAIPVIYVSHAVDEVARLASIVVVINGGRIVASGAPPEVLPPIEAGHDRFARISVLSAAVGTFDPAYHLTTFIHPSGNLTLAGEFGRTGRSVRIVVRATEVTLARVKPKDISTRTVLRGTIAGIEQGGDPVAMVVVALKGGDDLAAALTRKAVDELQLRKGDKIWCLLKSVSIDERWIASS
jgi:molybdate transport system ATP-binding protein